MSIKVENLTKVFGTQYAVNNISFDLEPGNIVGFLGPNGAGKSTTMKILSCFIPATSGRASVCGFDVEKNPIEVRRNLGYLPEKNPLYYDMYVREFLEMTAGIYQLGKQSKSRVDEMIDITGLTKEVHKKIGNLSKGYKQRVGLAQALIHRPKALILDEPTSGLDPNQIVSIRELIKQVSTDTTVLLSTHIMQEVQAMCNRVIIINNGSIIADGDIHSLGQLEQHKGQKPGIIVKWEQIPDIEQLKKIESVEEASLGSDKTWILTGKHPDNIRKQILQFSIEHNLDIVSLQKKETSLEELFGTLTKEASQSNQ